MKQTPTQKIKSFFADPAFNFILNSVLFSHYAAYTPEREHTTAARAVPGFILRNVSTQRLGDAYGMAIEEMIKEYHTDIMCGTTMDVEALCQGASAIESEITRRKMIRMPVTPWRDNGPLWASDIHWKKPFPSGTTTVLRGESYRL